MTGLTDSAFAGGAQVIEICKQEGRGAALAELGQMEKLRLLENITHLSNSLYRKEIKSLHQGIEADAVKARGSVRQTMCLLSGLAGVVFTFLIIVIVRTVRRVIHDRRAYHNLYEEQKKVTRFTRNLIDSSPVGYHSVNSDGIIIEINQTELDWLGYSREEVIGKIHISELYDEYNQVRFETLFNDLKAQGYLKNIELNLVTKGNEIVPVLFNSKAIYDDKGNFLHSISTIYNFTERKKLEDDLIAARKEAENANQLKQLFMTNMSHEIRTPLNAIIGFGNLLSRSELPANLREYIQSIQVSGNNLLSIVNDILDFEKISSGIFHKEQVEFDLPGLLQSVITMLRPSAAEKKLSLRLEMDPNLPEVVMGDPMHLTQVLINLLSNAVKFTESGSVALRVRVCSGTDTGKSLRIRFDVADTGIGIPESEFSRIFERFMQASCDTTRKYGGTGLGLALVKLIIEQMDGSVSLQSKVGSGSTFTIEIPFFHTETGHCKGSVTMVETIPIPDLSGYHILLVEDNPMNRRIAELNLLEFGLMVTQAENGREAMERLRSDPGEFDLVLMDIQMPEMDGYSTTCAIRSELNLNDLPIIAMTAHVLAGEREKVLACGMNDYLAKPVRHTELIKVLERYLPVNWDVCALQEFSRGKTSNFREISSLFIHQWPVELAGLKNALQNTDYARAAAISHSLRSTAGYTGFQASLGKLLLQIENEVRSHAPNHNLVEQLYNKLERNGGKAVSLLQRELFGAN